ncbi:hypothetical protein [Simplicispira suum]|uniref:hypothetical protein n=1 Tax=Simplicispira suum TaxID=2109915 RepID=UPI001FE7CE4B|nr:hypothetical protein [Simplicispira suum]
MRTKTLTLPIPARAQWAMGCLLAAWLALPFVRAALEQSMLRHMLLQAPLLLLAGACLAGAWARACARPLRAGMPMESPACWLRPAF